MIPVFESAQSQNSCTCNPTHGFTNCYTSCAFFCVILSAIEHKIRIFAQEIPGVYLNYLVRPVEGLDSRSLAANEPRQSTVSAEFLLSDCCAR